MTNNEYEFGPYDMNPNDVNQDEENQYYANLKDINQSNTECVDAKIQIPDKEEKPARRRGISGKIVALALSCALIGGAMGVGGTYLGDLLRGNDDDSASNAEVSTMLSGVRSSSVINLASIDTSKVMTAAEVYAANAQSTVGITTSVTNYWGYQTTSAASGSGFLITDTGYILTNYHVIESSNEITVSTYDGESYTAELIGYDESNDIAVLKIDAEDLVPVVIGDSDNMNVGDDVVAIGNPLGELTFSLTTGVVSALDREVTLSRNVTMDMIQTDCAINSGNSGGALFNMYGEVIGITNAKYSGSGSSSEASIDNIGFAIPVNNIKSIVESIIEKGYIVKPYIGVSVSNVSSEVKGYGLPEGASVQSVTADSPAEKAGLQANDIITSVNGKDVSGSSELVSIVSSCSAGDSIELTVYRQGETLEITVTVGEQTTSALASNENESDQQTQQQYGQGQWGGQGSFPWGNSYGN